MNIYQKKLRFKYLLFFGAICIGVGSLWYTNKLVDQLAKEERKKVELWANAISIVIQGSEENDLTLPVDVIISNETVPVVVINPEDNSIVASRNIDSIKLNNPRHFEKMLTKMKEEMDPLEITLGPELTQHLYYTQSIMLTKLSYYPYVQLSVIIIFTLVAYFAFSSTRKAEQNQVWVGLSKETAHQLGTPISSLMAWMEVLRSKLKNSELVDEFEKDVERLEIITERFSKIGSKPILKPENLNDIIAHAVGYLKSRSSNSIKFEVSTPDSPTILPLNTALFEWVLENTCKNSMDAITGKGTIKISVIDNTKFLFLDIEDNGKGIHRSKHKTIFKPGYTTKKRGWGLGLSLTKRIIEEYHGGKIFVSSSEPGKGTTLRIVLNR